MSSTLNRLQVGVVGVEPGIVFLVTSSTEAEIFSPGFINQIEQSNNVDIQKGDFIFVKYENGTLQEMCIPDVASNGVITLIPVAGDFNAGGPITGGQNLGGGAESFKDVAAGLMRFRTLVAGANVTVVEGADTITIDTATPPGGVINDGQNLGTGEGVFATASGDKLQFKSLTAGANISLTPTGNDITITATSAAGGTITDAINLGTGNGVFESAVGSDLRFKGLKSGANVTIVPDGDSLTISATTLGGGDISNGINVGGGSEVFKEVSGSNIIFRTLLAGSNINLIQNANDITISATGGGGGGNFDYVDTWYVASNGNDTNTGKNINEPKLTLAGARAAFTGLNNVIIIEDNGTYNSFFVEDVENAVTQIFAPNATFVGTIGPVFAAGDVSALISPTLIVECYKIVGNGTVPPLITYSGNDSYMSITAKTIDGSGQQTYVAITGSTNAGAIISSELIVGGMEFGTTVILSAANMVGNIETSTGIYTGQLLADLKTFNGTISGNGPTYGYVGSINPSVPSAIYSQNLSLKNKAIVQEIYKVRVTNFTFGITINDSNTLWLADKNEPTIVVNLPDWATQPNFPVGYRFWVCQTGAQRVLFTTADTIFQPQNYLWTNGRGALVQVTLLEDGGGTKYVWGLSGDMAASDNISQESAIYVSKLSGSDVTGDGTVGNPLATIGAGITLAGAPVSPVRIVITDNETYDENLVFPNPRVYLSGPTAFLQPAAGDAITLSYMASVMFINLGAIIAPTANAIRCTSGVGSLISITDIIIGGVTCSGSGSILYLTAQLLNSNITPDVGSQVRYSTIEKAGTDTGDVVGIESSGASDNWDVGATLTASGLVYPTADGTTGQAIVTDGAGTLSFATLAPVIPLVTVAGTSQIADVNTAYLCANVAQTTITLPALAADGSTIRVYGGGAGGWVLQAGLGQTILIGTTATSVTGSLTSAHFTDVVEVTCLVANATWRVNYAYSSGLTVA